MNAVKKLFQKNEGDADPPIDSAVDIDNEEQTTKGVVKPSRYGDEG